MGHATLASQPGCHCAAPNIIDIRQESLIPLADQIRSGLKPKDGGEKCLPTLLLYNEDGLKLFEKITYLDEYYLTGQEIQVLEQYADRVADRIATQPGSIVVELGSGNLRKVKILLDALDRKARDVSYYALDLSQVELERTLREVPDGTFENVKCYGLLGTYDDGLAWLKQPQNVKKPKTIMSLGSSIGNFSREDAAHFLAQFTDILNHNDSMVLGLDACTNAAKVYHAYNDRDGLTHEFILNGLKHANHLLGHAAFNVEDWKVIGKYNEQHDRHEAFVTPTRDVEVEDVAIRSGEEVRIEESWKYSWAQSEKLWRDAGLNESVRYMNAEGNYAIHLLNRPKVSYPATPDAYAAHPVPSLADWDDLWKAWDAVTRDMIPEEELLGKPIKLRNACIFYLGHIPTFMDIHLTRATQSKPTEPSYYPQIFERGIDPDVDNPEQCHSHSEIPDSWPPAPEILDFQSRVRIRVQKLYASGQAVKDRGIARAMWLGYEHEIMHLETLLYMLVQSEKTLAPPGTILPDFQALAAQAKQTAVANEWIHIPAQTVEIGLEDPDDNSGPEHYFGWDNEKPIRTAHVAAFDAKARPITNGEYAHYLEKTGGKGMPASWVSKLSGTQTNGSTNGHVNGESNPSQSFIEDKAVRTVYGAIPLKLALEWPVSASYDELNGCARWMGGRIPTLEEARSVYQYVDRLKRIEAQNALESTIPAVNGHLVNDGVEESPPPSQPHLIGRGSAGASGPNPNDLFIDLDGANVGFKHWHPMPVSQNGGTLSGQSGMGGVWEWTSTVLAKHDGFEPMELYPGYTADFFDSKHNVVLGGSWATHPRIAGRKTFVNWYQRNYPYVWAGARLVRDV
ncbi:hypothetical protein MBLNU459_g6565t1 [Dothideomycetes sp. NU459]